MAGGSFLGQSGYATTIPKMHIWHKNDRLKAVKTFGRPVGQLQNLRVA